MSTLIGPVIVEADGGSRGNPGPAGYGAVVFDAATHAVLAERKDSLGIATNNVAEYRGLIAGLTAALELGAASVAVRMDSKLVVEQMSGRWQVKNETLRPLVREAADLRARIGSVTFEWIPRERNKHADRLANEAMDEAMGRPARKSASAPAAVPSTGWAPAPGEPTRLILVRHGSTVHSPERRFSGRNDLPLSALGEQQAAALARRAPTFGTVAAVVSSPLPRARQTAETIAGALDCKVEFDDDLIEIDFGAWEGATFGEVNEREPGALSAWLSTAGAAPPGGETYASLVRRVRRARDTIIANYPGQAVVVVTHVTPIKALLALALDIVPSPNVRIHLDTASVSLTSYFTDGLSSVRLVNDTSHLGQLLAP